MIKLTQDSGFPKKKVCCTKDEIELAAKTVLGWRTPTKDYKTIYERFKKAGSSDYDKVIDYLYERGYEC